MYRCKMTAFIMLIGGILALLIPAKAETHDSDVCFIEGEVQGERNLDKPELGEWRYTLIVTWNTGSDHSLEQINLSFGESPDCSCSELEAGLLWQEHQGWSTGLDHGESSSYRSKMECDGDSSQGIQGPMVKLEPDDESEKGPGSKGRGEFVFYSQYAPWRILNDNRFMSMKYDDNYCKGALTGVFPGLPCDPTPNQTQSWSMIKGYYR